VTTYNGYDLAGCLGGRGIYRHHTRGLAIEKDHGGSHPYLAGMTAEETTAWKSQLHDAAMLAQLEEERAKQIAEDWAAEIGHGRSSGRRHLPMVI